MPISIGSTNAKPYVGDKEVKEAYVGSQLVYKSGLPYNYYFLGGENDYFISENLQLGSNATIAKPKDKSVYKIAITYTQDGTSIIGYVNLINVEQFIGWNLKFTYSGVQNSTLYIRVIYIDTSGKQIKYEDIKIQGTSENLYTRAVPANCGQIKISAGSQFGYRYIDNIRFEQP